MSASTWEPTLELSAEEKFSCAQLKHTGTLFMFLRHHRHKLFDEPFRAALGGDVLRPTPRYPSVGPGRAGPAEAPPSV